MNRPFLIPITLTGALVFALSAHAAGTRFFALDSAAVLKEGKLEGTSITSDGSIVPSVEVRKLALDGTPIARCLLSAPDGTAYVGTGNDGKIYRVTGSDVALFAETKQALVTSLAMDAAGTLYAGTLPAGKIFAVDSKGTVKEFAAPEKADHVWALEYLARTKTLFAATGPEGKVFAIDANGKADVYLDTEADHVMALDLDGDVLYAGTSGEALVYRVRGAGRSEVVYDFEGNEITALDARDGTLAVAANLFPKAPAAAKKPTPKTSDNESPAVKAAVAQARAKPGKGALWRVDADGRAEKLFDSAEGHITAVQWGEDGAIFAATGKGGDVFRVLSDGTHGLWIDVDERQVLDMDLTGKSPLFVTGDAGAIYRVVPGRAQNPLWTSKALDARFPARWGGLTWRGKGKVSFQTRSGNTEKPEHGGWSEWSAALTRPGPIRSPGARFLQVRARLDGKADSLIYAVEAYYLAQNQSASLHSLEIKPASEATKGKAKSNPRAAAAASSTQYKIDWKADNPDGDPLRYRLYFRLEDQTLRRAILREDEVLSESSYTWDTNGLPDGHYRIVVEATDEAANPAVYVARSKAVSEPFIVDNHPPDITGLAVKGRRITGTASDSLGPISGLEYSIDGMQWNTFFPKDDLFDTDTEAFDLDLSALPAGTYLIAVRAADARDNTVTQQLEAVFK